jgi:quercetin dioxygenase-like cupin family protein
MQVRDCLAVSRKAVSGSAGRAATAIVHDSEDARVVVFRLDSGDAVPMHTSTSTVILSVVRGTGTISGPIDGELHGVTVSEGGVVVYEPNEPHGMSAPAGPFVVMATISPRPGGRASASVAAS